MDLGRERADLEGVVGAWREYRDTETAIDETQLMANDSDREMAELAQEELVDLRAKLEDLEGTIRRLLVPKDPNDEKNVIVEIRAGTGGDEAALFAADLYRMYTRYAERMGWKVESSPPPRPTGEDSARSSSRSGARAPTATSATRAASIACSACR